MTVSTSRRRQWTGRDGLSIVGDVWGDPDAPLVILLHGGGQTRHAWKGAGQQISGAGYHAVALDARGHGDSDWDPSGDYGDDAMVDDLVQVLGALVPSDRSPVLIGASMGGITSLLAAGEGRVDAAALVLVDVAAHLEPEGVANVRAFMRDRPEGFGSLQEVADAIAAYQPQRPRPATVDGLAKNVRLGSDGRYRWHWDPRFGRRPADFRRREERLVAAARGLRQPTLLVRGGMSDVLSEVGAEAFLALCPHSEYVNVSGSGHMVAGDRNDAFVDATVRFLAASVPIRRPESDARR
jgi:non-heme chloroperoxidase